MNCYHHRNPLEIKQLDEFDASIAHLTKSRQRRRRLTYLHDAAQESKTGQSMLGGIGWLLIPFAIIPILWPFFIFVWFVRKKAVSGMDSQLEKALEYWGIHEVEIDEYVTEETFD